ncbi:MULTISPECIES: hypothetical protein [Spirulina sp. CCY15215]|nr:hypothetical protein [Spirulina major]
MITVIINLLKAIAIPVSYEFWAIALCLFVFAIANNFSELINEANHF